MTRPYELHQGDALETLRTLPAGIARTCVTSPPYFGLRDYGVDGQLGLEDTPAEYVQRMVTVFREVRRVLTGDGTLWLNFGDSYAGSWGAQSRNGNEGGVSATQIASHPKGQTGTGSLTRTPGLKAKDLIGVPWRVAFALQADGWWLRSDIIWHKPNPMPESVTDRPTKAHEYIFLLTKSERYYYDVEAIKEPLSESTLRIHSGPGVRERDGGWKCDEVGNGHSGLGNGQKALRDGRNKRSVWSVTTRPYSGAHFAVFPPDLIRPCILAGSEPGDTVLDPFNGSGTTGVVALQHDRKYIGIELNPDYIALTEPRLAAIHAQPQLFPGKEEAA